MDADREWWERRRQRQARREEIIRRVVAAIAIAGFALWAGYSFGSDRAWTKAEHEALRVWVAGYCRGVGDGAIYMTSRVTGESVNDLYGAGHVPDPFLEERLNEKGLSMSDLDDVLGEAVTRQLPVALYNWDLRDIPSLEGRYTLEDLEKATDSYGDWCKAIANEPGGPPDYSAHYLKEPPGPEYRYDLPPGYPAGAGD